MHWKRDVFFSGIHHIDYVLSIIFYKHMVVTLFLKTLFFTAYFYGLYGDIAADLLPLGNILYLLLQQS